MAREYNFDLSTPFCDLSREVQDIIIHGTNGHEVKVYYKGKRGEGVYDVAFEGLLRNVQRRYRENHSERQRAEYENFMTVTPCDSCHGQRLKPESLAVTVGQYNISELTCLSVKRLISYFNEIELPERKQLIGKQVLREIRV